MSRHLTWDRKLNRKSDSRVLAARRLILRTNSNERHDRRRPRSRGHPAELRRRAQCHGSEGTAAISDQSRSAVMPRGKTRRRQGHLVAYLAATSLRRGRGTQERYSSSTLLAPFQI